MLDMLMMEILPEDIESIDLLEQSRLDTCVTASTMELWWWPSSSRAMCDVAVHGAGIEPTETETVHLIVCTFNNM